MVEMEWWKPEFVSQFGRYLNTREISAEEPEKDSEELKEELVEQKAPKAAKKPKDFMKLAQIVMNHVMNQELIEEVLREQRLRDASEDVENSETPEVVYEEVTRETTFDAEEDSEDPRDLEVGELQETVWKLSEETEKVKMDDKKVTFEEVRVLGFRNSVLNLCFQEHILAPINGTWQIVSSIGMEEYLQKWNVPMSYIGAVIFQVGVQKISFNPDTNSVTIRDIIGIHEHFKTELKLGEKVTVDNLTYLTFVKKNSLVTVLLRDDDKEEFARMKRFVKDGRLHVVMKRFGMSCTRIYEKVGTKPTESEESLQKRVIELEAELDHKIQNIGLLHEKVQEMIEAKKRDRKDLEELKQEKRELKETLARRTYEISQLREKCRELNIREMKYVKKLKELSN